MRRLLMVVGLTALGVLLPSGIASACRDGHGTTAFIGSLVGQSAVGVAALAATAALGILKLVRR